MAASDTNPANIFQFNLERRKGDGPGLEQLVKGVVSGIEELEQRQRELEERNTQLESALKQANERMARFEESACRNAELTKAALATVAQTLGHAEEAVDSLQRGANNESTQRYTEAARRLLELQKEVIPLLEKAREEIARRNQETDQRAIEILREARKSVLAITEDVGGSPPDQGPAPLIGRAAGEAPVGEGVAKAVVDLSLLLPKADA